MLDYVDPGASPSQENRTVQYAARARPDADERTYGLSRSPPGQNRIGTPALASR